MLEGKNEWQAQQNKLYHEILADAQVKGLSEDKIACLFAGNYNQYEQDKVDVVDDLKDHGSHSKIIKKVTKKFSDMVCILILVKERLNSTIGCKY